MMLFKDIDVFFQLMIVARKFLSLPRVPVEISWNPCSRENFLHTLSKVTLGNLFSNAKSNGFVGVDLKYRTHNDCNSSCPLMPRFPLALLGVFREEIIDKSK